MKKSFIYLILTSFLLSSCAAVIKPVDYNVKEYTHPDLNEVNSRDIGEQLVVKGIEDVAEAYVIKSMPDFTMSMMAYPVRTGEVLPLSGQTKEWLLYYTKNQHPNYIAGIAKNKQNPKKIQPFLNSANGFSTRRIEGFNVEQTTYSESCSKCFKKEFIYNGRVENNIKFIYREYIKELARPSFTQELQYDLNDSNIIGFKGLRIEVIKATNTKIEYKILNDFN